MRPDDPSPRDSAAVALLQPLTPVLELYQMMLYEPLSNAETQAAIPRARRYSVEILRAQLGSGIQLVGLPQAVALSQVSFELRPDAAAWAKPTRDHGAGIRCRIEGKIVRLLSLLLTSLRKYPITR